MSESRVAEWNSNLRSWTAMSDKVPVHMPRTEAPAPVGLTGSRFGWASAGEFEDGLKRLDLLNGGQRAAGVVLGSSDDGTVLVDDSDAHKLIIGGTGSGKTRRTLMQSVLSLIGTEDGAVVFDPKGEICRYTREALAEDGFDIRVLDLRCIKDSAGFNPFSWIYGLYNEGTLRSRDRAMEMLNAIAATVCPVLDKDDVYWESTAQSLIAGLGWEVLKRAEDIREMSIFEIYRLCNEVFHSDSSREAFREAVEGDVIQSMMLGPALENSDVTRRCVLSITRQHLQPFVQSRTVVDLLSRDDIRFHDIVRGKTVVYIVAPEEKDTYNPLVSMFVKLFYEYMTDVAYSNRSGALDHTIHFFLDEFGNLPAIPGFSSMLTAARSRNIRFALVLQSLNQLDTMYSQDANTIRGNCLCWIFFSSKDMSTLREVKDLAGTDSNRKDLVSTTELQRLDKDAGEALVLRDRKGPYITHLSDISVFVPEPAAEVCPPRESGTADVWELAGELSRILSTPEYPVTISEPDVRVLQKFVEDIGFDGDAGKLAEIVTAVATTGRYMEVYEYLRDRGYLDGVAFGEGFKTMMKPVRGRFGYLRLMG